MIGHLVCIVGAFAITSAVYQNDFDGPLNFQCSSDTQTISRIHSIHDNGKEDRRFELSCRDFLSPDMADGLSQVQCYWTDYQNSYDKPLVFSCPTNNYITGMQSVHDNDSEDRIWKFRCCSIAEIHMSDCSFSGWTNDFDKPQDYPLPANTVLKGAMSVHDNGPEDRRYEYEYCGIYKKTSDGPIIG